MLCDDNIFTLYQLKTKLISEIAKYRISDVNYEQYSDLKRELENVSTPRFRDVNLEQHYAKEIKTALKEHDESMRQINKLERSIKKIEPGFKLCLRPK
jgi:t-SNARE complex subunit (syntaxin)